MSLRIRVCRHPGDLAAFGLFDLPHCLAECPTCPALGRFKPDRADPALSPAPMTRIAGTVLTREQDVIPAS